MYSNGGSLGIRDREKWRENVWRHNDEESKSFKNGKRFVRCICPKCAGDHNIYMLWTGRGVPRKYCGNCKPLISGYDDAALYEVSVSASDQLEKGRGQVSE